MAVAVKDFAQGVSEMDLVRHTAPTSPPANMPRRAIMLVKVDPGAVGGVEGRAP